MKKIKTGYLLVGTFVLLIGLLFTTNYLNKSNEAELLKNGIETSATITKLDVNSYKANEMEGTFVENYVFTLEFSVDGKKFKSVRTIEKKDYANFFDRSLKVHDVIPILYDAENPKNNRIKELNLAKK